jgi:putative FmdB family regulatory protein
VPIYTFQCDKCERRIDRVKAIELRDDGEECECGEKMVRQPVVNAEPKIVGGTERFYE